MCSHTFFLRLFPQGCSVSELFSHRVLRTGNTAEQVDPFFQGRQYLIIVITFAPDYRDFSLFHRIVPPVSQFDFNNRQEATALEINQGKAPYLTNGSSQRMPPPLRL